MTKTTLNEKLKANVEALNEKKAEAPAVSSKKKMELLLKKMEPEIGKALGQTLDPIKFTRNALSLYNSNANFLECEPLSFISALMMSAQLGLEPNTNLGHAYLIPYKGKISFQLGYKGLIELCFRSGMIKKITARTVFKEDKFEYEYGLEDILKHKPSDMPTGDPVYYYAKYELTNGAKDFAVWSREKIIAHAKQYSKTFSRNDSAWQTSFDSMALKTCIIDALRYAPKSTIVAKAIVLDNTIKEGIDENMEDVIDAVEVDFTEAPKVETKSVDVEYKEKNVVGENANQMKI